MQKNNLGRLFRRLISRKAHYPWYGHIDLTYRCNLDCIHCYCRGSEDKDSELTTAEWKKILDEIHREGCIWLSISGGEPLLREDFLEIYTYAKKKGFLIVISTNGQEFTEKIFNYLVKYPPFSIEITLNSITKDTYESITQVKGSFAKVMATIKELKRRNIRLILKFNCLKQNKDEISKIKAWVKENLGKLAEDKHRFRFDVMIHPRLNGDKSPCQYRPSFEELLEARKQDLDIWEEYQKNLCGALPDLGSNRELLYYCNSWLNSFFVDPYGRLKFCMLSDKFSTDLKTTPFREGFYHVFPQVSNQRFKTKSKCRDCDLRPLCYHCPARAFLETGDEEAPVEYFCRLAEETQKQRERVKSGVKNEVLNRI